MKSRKLILALLAIAGAALVALKIADAATKSEPRATPLAMTRADRQISLFSSSTKKGATVTWIGYNSSGMGRRQDYFLCTLSNNHKSPLDNAWASYDLYDIGAQANAPTILLGLQVLLPAASSDYQVLAVTDDDTQANPPVVAPSSGVYEIIGARYDRTTTAGARANPRTLRFRGDACTIKVWFVRIPTSPESDGSPPPPYPGEDQNDSP